MSNQLKKILEKRPIEASAPCRIDMGGTLDIPVFYYPLRHLAPCTFNIAVGLRTRVRLLPYTRDLIKISSSGFESAEFQMNSAPFRHPMGLMFATAAYFQAGGVHIEIESKSPPRSALGGSSAATVALVAAFFNLMRPASGMQGLMNRRGIALLAYKIEETVAGVPCGIQDQLAAAYGGVNVWHLQANPQKSVFQKQVVIKKSDHVKFARHLLLAYCGMPHESKDINDRWVQQFLDGENRSRWAEIVDCTRIFVDAIVKGDIELAVSSVNRETQIRRELTPEVVDSVGEKLVDAAENLNCGARFTGAGGGGCIWALGLPEDIDRLRKVWEETLSQRKNARLLDLSIDSSGVMVH
jgi:D-glycero-alpha-D-manno-heptose-7-phosphate kinase